MNFKTLNCLSDGRNTGRDLGTCSSSQTAPAASPSSALSCEGSALRLSSFTHIFNQLIQSTSIMKKYIAALAVALFTLSFSSCSFMNEPNEDDYVRMAQHYDAEAIGIVGNWESSELGMNFSNHIVDGYYTGLKMIEGRDEAVEILWQVVHFEHPSEYGYGQDLTRTGGYIRILGKNYVGNTWLFEMHEDGSMTLTDPSGIAYKMHRADAPAY